MATADPIGVPGNSRSLFIERKTNPRQGLGVRMQIPIAERIAKALQDAGLLQAQRTGLAREATEQIITRELKGRGDKK